MPDPILIASLLGGLVIMAFAGDFLVKGAIEVARRIGVSPLMAGIFIVGFGTSAPEMLVSLDAALDGRPGLAIGNIVGSNIANVWLVLAIPALLGPVVAGGYGQRRALFVMLLATAAWILITSTIGLHAGVGLAFILAIILYSVYTYTSMRSAVRAGIDVGLEEEAASMSLIQALIFVPLGVAGLVLGAHLIVEGGVGLAQYFGVSEELIGLTLLAVGTSLPEIGAGIAAVMNNRGSLLFGNIIGSNLFNILGAGGIVALVGNMGGNEVNVAQSFHNYDHWAMGAAALTAALLIFARSRVSRLAAILFLLIYTTYIYGLINGFNILALFGQGAT